MILHELGPSLPNLNPPVGHCRMIVNNLCRVPHPSDEVLVGDLLSPPQVISHHLELPVASSPRFCSPCARRRCRSTWVEVLFVIHPTFFSFPLDALLFLLLELLNLLFNGFSFLFPELLLGHEPEVLDSRLRVLLAEVEWVFCCLSLPTIFRCFAPSLHLQKPEKSCSPRSEPANLWGFNERSPSATSLW